MKLIDFIAAGFIWFFLFVLAHIVFPTARDDSDSPTERSGMSIRRDHLTGCEYLSKANVLTPRMDSNGKQICRERQEK